MVPSSPNSLVPRLELGKPCDFTVGIVQIAEYQRLRCAGLRAGGGEFAVLQVALFRLCLNLGGLDALHAEGAFLHNADAAHRDVRIQLQLQRHVPLRVVIVEEADVVRAGIGAKAGADATVVDLRIQTFGRVIAGVGRADGLARSFVALLTEDRLKADFGVGEIALPITLDTNPMLRSASRSLILARGRDVIFRMARDDTRFAAGAAIEIHYQSPFMGHRFYLPSPRTTCRLAHTVEKHFQERSAELQIPRLRSG